MKAQPISEIGSYRGLAAGIIALAVQDKELIRKQKATVKKELAKIENEIKSGAYKARELQALEVKREHICRRQGRCECSNFDVKRFLESDWFETLCEGLDLNPDYLRKKLAEGR